MEPAQRLRIEPVEQGIWHMTAQFGFVEIPNIPAALAAAKAQGCPIELDKMLYFAARDEVLALAEETGKSGAGSICFLPAGTSIGLQQDDRTPS